MSITRPPSAATRSLRWGLAVAATTFVAVIHWLSAAHVLTGGWTAAIPHTTAGYVLTFLPIALLILPEVGSITVGGLKVEMRKTQDEVSKLGAQIQQLQILQATAAASEKAADTADDVPSAAVDAFLI